MAVLLIRANGSIGEILVKRLVEQGDQVRVIEISPEAVEAWEEAGTHVVRGDPRDAELVADASQHVRTIILMDDEAGDVSDIIEPVIEGARRAKVGRLVFFGWNPPHAVTDAIVAAGMDHIILTAGKRRLLGKKVPASAIAEAIDAADDLAGNPRLVLDLRDPAAWAALRLPMPA